MVGFMVGFIAGPQNCSSDSSRQSLNFPSQRQALGIHLFSLLHFHRPEAQPEKTNMLVKYFIGALPEANFIQFDTLWTQQLPVSAHFL